MESGSLVAATAIQNLADIVCQPNDLRACLRRLDKRTLKSAF